MFRDDPLLHAPNPPAHLVRPPAPDAMAPDPALVLFIGPAVRPDRALGDTLQHAGLRCTAVSHLAAAQAASEHLHFDAVVADAAALGPSLALGLSALRPMLSCPVLVAATEPSEIDAIVALEHGASHYLGWPLAPRHLRAQLRALMPGTRADPAARPPDALQAAGWQLDEALRELRGAGHTVPLTAAQVAMLRCLASPAGRLVHRAELEACAAAPGAPLMARSIDVYVHRLRRRLAEAGATGLDIDCVRGRGYRLRSTGTAPSLS